MRSKRLRRVLLYAAMLGLFASCASTHTSTPAPPEHPLFDLNGTWTGQLKAFQAPGISPKSMDYELWITIRGDEASVWYKYEGKWNPLWDGARRFTVAQHKSNAVISASNSKPSVECHWVETWSLTVSQFRPNALETLFYRVVNNTGCPDARTQFAYAATGQMTRVSGEMKEP